MTYNYLSLLVFLGFMLPLSAQNLCEDPNVLVADDASSYELGDLGTQSYWGVPSFATTGVVVDTFQMDNVFTMGTDPTTQSGLFFTGDQTSGHYLLTWIQYLPAGTPAYFDVQHQVPDANSYQAFSVVFNGDEVGSLTLTDNPGTAASNYGFVYPEDEWFRIYLFVDLDNDVARLLIDETTVSVWTFSDGIESGTGDEYDLLQLSAIGYSSFVGATEDWYFDNLEMLEIEPAGAGQYCYLAEEIGLGTHTVPDLVCFGGGYDLGGGDGAEKGYWFRYTATEDGILSISSCDQGVDTRGWIFVGDECGDLEVLGINDDMCDTGLDDDYASYREALVTAGQTYYILWDNAWESAGFDFTLALSTEEPAPGDFCETAIPIEPGEQILDEFTGNAGFGGGRIGTSGSSSTMPYINSEWYSFTPETDGFMTITSCEGAASDTWVFVYTGSCTLPISGLTEVANSDDDCGPGVFSSQIENLPVTAGETYLIEWIDRWDEDSFFWDLIFDPVSNTQETTLAAAWEVFPNPASDLLRINIELPEASDQLSLRLHNSLGALFREQQLQPADHYQTTLEVDDLPAGLYWLELTNGQQHLTQKVIIQ
jgi:hypothetical protein